MVGLVVRINSIAIQLEELGISSEAIDILTKGMKKVMEETQAMSIDVLFNDIIKNFDKPGKERS